MPIQTQKYFVLAIIQLVEVVCNIGEVFGVESELISYIINLSSNSRLNVLLPLSILCQSYIALVNHSTDFLPDMCS